MMKEPARIMSLFCRFLVRNRSHLESLLSLREQRLPLEDLHASVQALCRSGNPSL